MFEQFSPIILIPIIIITLAIVTLFLDDHGPLF